MLSCFSIACGLLLLCQHRLGSASRASYVLDPVLCQHCNCSVTPVLQPSAPVFSLTCVSIAIVQSHLCYSHQRLCSVSHVQALPLFSHTPGSHPSPPVFSLTCVSIAIVQSHLCYSHHRLCSVSHVSALQLFSHTCATSISACVQSHMCQHCNCSVTPVLQP